MQSPSSIIQSLGFPELDILLAQDQINIDAIQRKTLFPPQIIKSKLLEYQSKFLKHIIQPLSQMKPGIKDGFRLNKFFPSSHNNALFWPERVQMQQVYEVTGKSNTGKTYLCYCLLEEALSNNKYVVLFDTANNFCPQKLAQWFGQEFIMKYQKFIKWFPVNTIKQLGEYLHFLQKITKQYDVPSVIIIDSLSYLIQGILFTQNSSTFTAIRRLFSNLIDTTMTCILFTTMSYASLFPTLYTKNQQHRFKNMHAAMWDSLANNALILDSVLQINENTGKVIRKTKVCLYKAAKEYKFHDFQCIQV